MLNFLRNFDLNSWCLVGSCAGSVVDSDVAQWTHICQFTINLTSKFHVEISLRFHRF